MSMRLKALRLLGSSLIAVIKIILELKDLLSRITTATDPMVVHPFVAKVVAIHKRVLLPLDVNKLDSLLPKKFYFRINKCN
jgi:hypothetical protein